MTLIGIDIGGTNIKYAFLTEKGEVLARFSLRFDYAKSQEEEIASLAASINENIALLKLDKKSILGIGVGCPGSINSQTGYCDYSNNLHWESLPVCQLITTATGLPCKIANDANAATLGEVRFGVAKKYHNMVLLTLGTGVGGGLYLNDGLYEGNEGKGAELGHTTLVMDGEPCTCGRRGCLEAYCSVTALKRETKEAMLRHPRSLMWGYVRHNLTKISGFTSFECAKRGDRAAQEVVAQYIHYLGEGCLNFINIFRPEAIVLGGGLSNQREFLVDLLKKYLEQNGYGFGGNHSPKVDVLVSSLGNDAGIYGAASLLLS